MANQYINVYAGEPTEGGVDGTLISEDDSDTTISVTLNADQSETATVKLAVRCDAGYYSVGDVVVRDSGDSNNRWSFSLTENGAFADSITLGAAVDSVNAVFWARAVCDSSEAATVDAAVKIEVDASVRATDSTIVLMHFDGDNYARDECGNSTDVGDDVIYEWKWVKDEEHPDDLYWDYLERDTTRRCSGVFGNAVNLGESGFIEIGSDNEDITFGGQDFTVDFWFKLDVNSIGDYWLEEYGFYPPTFELGVSWIVENSAYGIGCIKDDNIIDTAFGSRWGWGTRTTYVDGSYPSFNSREELEEFFVWRHYAFTYVHSERKLYAFLDGVLYFVEELDDPIERGTGYFDVGPYDLEHCYCNGYFDELRIVDGVAVWTSNFTPPNAPYSIPEPVNVSLLIDTSRTVTKTVTPEPTPEPSDNSDNLNNLCIVDIYDISLRTGDIFICNTDRDIMFEGKKYLAIPVQREEISRSVDNIDNDVKITMADATTDQLQFIIAGFDFRGCKVKIRQIVYPDSTYNDQLYRDCFYGYIDNPAYENGQFSCTLRARIPKVTVPRRTYQSTCNCKFGDALCGLDIDRTNGLIEYVSADNQIVIDAVKADDYWQNGIITIEGETRMIRASKGGIITTFYPFFSNIRVGMHYTVQRGCDKTFTSCKKFDNLQHFTGFPSIPYETIYR